MPRASCGKSPAKPGRPASCFIIRSAFRSMRSTSTRWALARFCRGTGADATRSPAVSTRTDFGIGNFGDDTTRRRGQLPRITFVYFDAGGGHRSAIESLLTVIERQQRSWEISTLNLQDTLDQHDIVRRLTGLRVQDVYNRMLASGWTL